MLGLLVGGRRTTKCLGYSMNVISGFPYLLAKPLHQVAGVANLVLPTAVTVGSGMFDLTIIKDYIKPS